MLARLNVSAAGDCGGDRSFAFDRRKREGSVALSVDCGKAQDCIGSVAADDLDSRGSCGGLPKVLSRRLPGIYRRGRPVDDPPLKVQACPIRFSRDA
jgi:hypothetical protein